MEIKIADSDDHEIVVQIVINNKQIKMIEADITNKYDSTWKRREK